MIYDMIRGITTIALCLALTANAALAGQKKEVKKYNAKRTPALADTEWYGDNAQSLRNFMARYGDKSSSYNKDRKPVAAFDWDNTTIKNDVGDAVLYWLIAHDLIKKPKSWRSTSAFLTDEAVRQLNEDCPLSGSSEFVSTRNNSKCADTVLSIYVDGKSLDGKTEAWSKIYDADTLEPAYAWNVHLAAGYSPNELRTIAKEAIEFNLSNPPGAKQKLGSKEFDAWVRVYSQIKDLIASLQESGFDVWIISASSQFYVDVFAKWVNIESDHVIGVRATLDGNGLTTAGLEACGNSSSGNQTLITYRQGKRCWINKVIFGIKDPKDMMERPSPTVFAAGDSDTDVYFVKDATGLRLAINRNKLELMCNAFANLDGKWLVNPMFISPKSKKERPYDCAKFGFGSQEDKVFGFYQ